MEKKKFIFKLSSPPPAVYTCLPQGSGQSRYQWGLPVEGRQSYGYCLASGVLGRTGSPEVRASWSLGLGGSAPCPANPFRLR